MHHRGTDESSGRSLMSGPLAGKRILVVEDEYLIGAMVTEMLSAAGADIVGPATSRNLAVALARTEQLDCAILDIDLRGERSDAVAAELQRRNIPFVLATGYGEADIVVHGAPVLAKPFTEHKLLEGLIEVLQSVQEPGELPEGWPRTSSGYQALRTP